MKLKFRELGYGLISVFLFQISLSILSIKTSINFMELKNYTNTSSLSYLQLYGEILTSALIIISIIIIVFRKKAGLILYLCSIILSILLSIFFGEITLESIAISLIIPVLTLFLVYLKRNFLFR